MTFREKGTPVLEDFPAAIPIFSVPTVQDAVDLQVLTCRLYEYTATTDQGIEWPKTRYIVIRSSGFQNQNVFTLDIVAIWLEYMWRELKRRREANAMSQGE